ncbi:hypothetical protein BDV3_001048 [Batrachochytrium dendrobatidis]
MPSDVLNIKVFWQDRLPPVHKAVWLMGWTCGNSVVCVTQTSLLTSSIDKSFFSVPSNISIVGIGFPADATRRVLSSIKSMEIKLKKLCPIWITILMDPTGKIPVISDVEFRDDPQIVRGRYIIYYTCPAPRSLQYYSTHPLILNVSLLNTGSGFNNEHESISNSTLSSRHLAPPNKLSPSIMPKIIHHTTTVFSSIGNVQGEDIEYIFGKINIFARNSGAITQSKRSQNYSTATLDRSNSNLVGCIKPFLWKIFCQVVVYPIFLAVFVFKIVGQFLVWILNSDVIFFNTSLTKTSTAMHQVQLRLQQILFWPQQYMTWHTSNTKLSAKAQARYIGFFNTVWLVANDIIIGLALGSVIIDYRYEISAILIDLFKTCTIEWVDTTIQWLMGWPAGLKLNSELNSFIGELFGWLVLSWSEIFLVVADFIPDILLLVGKTGVFGATMSISILSDLIMLATVHLHLFYIISAKMYYWQITVIQSLFTLFRGKKRNALRNRVDSAEYDLDQLMLGTCFFTLLVFLLPTVAVYYMLFSVCRIGVVIIHAVLEVVLAILNHFPLFAVMLRFKDPGRLPQGIQFTPILITESSNLLWRFFGWKQRPNPSTDETRVPQNIYIRLKSVPIGFSSIFYQYRFLYERLTRYHLSSQSIKSLFTGEIISTIPRLQYPSMPTKVVRPPNIAESWERMHSRFTA